MAIPDFVPVDWKYLKESVGQTGDLWLSGRMIRLRLTGKSSDVQHELTSSLILVYIW